MIRRYLSRLVWFLPIVALAAVVSSADIVQAIQNSPNASAWLKANAQAAANLAINVESGGSTTAYNGSCCYGVLQMNRTNIDKYAGVTPEQYRNLSLQEQINAWSKLTTAALNAGIVNRLIGLGTFDGRPVDGNLILACVQLGIGNCQRMFNSGSCSGFADSNGTTICSMADRMVYGQAPGTGGGTHPPTGNGAGSGGSSSSAGSGFESCPRDASGACMPISEALQQGFLEGSGTSMQNMRTQTGLLSTALCFLIVAAAMTGIWGQYAAGKISSPQLIRYAVSGGITISIVLLAMTLV